MVLWELLECDYHADKKKRVLPQPQPLLAAWVFFPYMHDISTADGVLCKQCIMG